MRRRAVRRAGALDRRRQAGSALEPQPRWRCAPPIADRPVCPRLAAAAARRPRDPYLFGDRHSPEAAAEQLFGLFGSVCFWRTISSQPDPYTWRSCSGAAFCFRLLCALRQLHYTPTFPANGSLFITFCFQNMYPFYYVLTFINI